MPGVRSRAVDRPTVVTTGPTASWTLPVVAIIGTYTGLGFYLLSQNGAVYAFGDAQYYGNLNGAYNFTGAWPLPGTGVAAYGGGSAAGSYGFVACDAIGGVFAYGPNALYTNSLPGLQVVPPGFIISIAGSADGGGQILLDALGNAYAIGDEDYLGGA